MDKRISMGEIVIRIWIWYKFVKGDGKLLITYVSTKSKEKEKRYKSKLHCEKKEKNQKSANQRST